MVKGCSRDQNKTIDSFKRSWVYQTHVIQAKFSHRVSKLWQFLSFAILFAYLIERYGNLPLDKGDIHASVKFL